MWVDREGLATPVPAEARSYIAPQISPDGRRFAVWTQGREQHIWVYDIERGQMSRVTTSGAHKAPIWTTDGGELTISSAFAGPLNLFSVPADGSGAPERLATSARSHYAQGWSSATGQLVFWEDNDLWLMNAGEEPQRWLETPFKEEQAKLSPDGEWVAFASDRSGRYEVYVQALFGDGSRHQISSDGGASPVWARSGAELFYRTGALMDMGMGDKLMAVDVTLSPDFSAGRPQLLFPTEAMGGAPETSYDVASDGRFLMVEREGPRYVPTVTSVNLVLNWFEELKARVPSN